MLQEDIHAAIDHGSETERVDYKDSFAPSAQADWLEIIKDIVALANSGGGAIIFGIADDGTANGFDCAPLFSIDPADVTNRLSNTPGNNSLVLGVRLERHLENTLEKDRR